MISVYLLIGIVCVILLAIFAALGGIADLDVDGGDLDVDFDGGVDVDAGVEVGEGFGDFGGPGVSPLSMPVILMWGTTFGAVGGILEALEWNQYVVPMVAAIVGIGGAGLMFVSLVKMSHMAQADSAVNPKELIGEDGEVWVPIKPGQGGKIVVETKERGRGIYNAYADEELRTGTPIIITEAMSSGFKVRRQ